MMNVLLVLLAQTATSVWSPPVQAQWAADGSSIKVRIVSSDKPIPLHGATAVTVFLSSDDESLRVSPFMKVTRGIAFEVIDQSGKMVAPREPIAISPPAPPLSRSKLVAATPNNPLKVEIGERASNLFPKAGRYRIRAVVSLMNVAAVPAISKQVRSNYVAIEVTD
jgi:hypothetical protein